mmetsp:Transcript_11282/g.23749  ORF Transcript_11282/g.23749 Transcript_11282/m.23749 type:complete len:702 (+) Transcript_11282:462-2567(+)|eukprot:CAMPEP_0178479622 /NCGR_PEP_ID=MMETSP0696-20121128/5276_1 /TAXON_ID=265572 /ORGANISM="Extubocellulus spinifer, Strain CCMP396" /LENGTH=701 /DNA_ID=CAMNT_0020107039 /DNA_START=351 /DNA_END=2456 /DNA_ORIENTATION=-
MATSEIGDCSAEVFPFTFYDSTGKNVSGVPNDEGICIFPDANCGVDATATAAATAGGGSAAICCEAKSEYTVTGSMYMFIAFGFIFFLNAMYSYFFAKLYTESRFARTAMDAMEEKSGGPWWMQKMPTFVQKVFKMGLWVSVTVAVVSPIFMKDSVQRALVVTSRNILMSSEAFLVPYKEIFQFIEDIVSVRVNYALRRGDKSLTDQLVHAGIAGSFLTGLLAAGVATILGVIPSVLRALTNPGLSSDIALYPGCDIILAAGENQSAILSYWLVEVWSFPGAQLGMVLNGFMLGALEIPTTGWIMAISLSMTPLIWFTKVGASGSPLLLLSWAEFAAAWVYPVLSICYIISPLGSTLRENTGVSLSLSKLRKSIVNSFSPSTPNRSSRCKQSTTTQLPNDEERLAEGNGEESVKDAEESTPRNEEELAENDVAKTSDDEGELSTRDLLRDGLKVMAIDVVVQVCASLTVYLALAQDGAVAYQITALQSQLPTYGIAYAFGMAMAFKIVGPIFISLKGYKYFARLCRIFFVCAFLFIPLIVGCTVPFSNGLAFDSGANACQYAGNDECVSFFSNVFGDNATGGEYTLPFTYRVFALASSSESIFIIFRAMLLTLMDLDYMMKSTGVAVCTYIAAIVVATQVNPFAEEAIAYIVAMYIPHITLIILFLVRLEVLIRRMARGEKGTWNTGKSTKSIGSALAALA